jgi:hypothetical protein
VLLLAAARGGVRPDGCLSAEDGDLLAAWGQPRPGWRGACAEWLAARGKLAEADALLAAPGDDAARLRVALARGDGAAARDAAEGAVVDEPKDVVACRILGAAALDSGDAAWAIEQAHCGGIGERAPDLVRLRAEALEAAGETDEAIIAYAGAGVTIHEAALLYQVTATPEHVAVAEHLLTKGPDAASPPAALHRVWLALMNGRTPSLDGLDGSVPATVARALVRRAPQDEAALAAAPGAPAAVVRARLAAGRGDVATMETALDAALAAAPASEPVFRARVALRLATHGDVAGALADWAAQDPDHVALVGRRGNRDMPWAALVPETWATLAQGFADPRMDEHAPSGADEVGLRWRAARDLRDVSARDDALAALGAAFPGLDALPAERYRLGPSPNGLPDRGP